MRPTTRGCSPIFRLEDRPYDDSHAIYRVLNRAVGLARHGLEAYSHHVGRGYDARRAHERVDIDPTVKAEVQLGQQIDLVGVMLTLIIGGVVGFVGLQVMSETVEQTALSQGDEFYNASIALEDAVGAAFSQLGVVFTVIILTVIVAYLTLMRRR